MRNAVPVTSVVPVIQSITRDELALRVFPARAHQADHRGRLADHEAFQPEAHAPRLMVREWARCREQTGSRLAFRRCDSACDARSQIRLRFLKRAQDADPN
jgi:hypothetical protein